MKSNADIESQAPTVLDDSSDRKSEKFENGSPENGYTSDPTSERAENTPPSGPDPNAFPDGGFEAWFCIAGGFCTVFSSFGWVNCRVPMLMEN